MLISKEKEEPELTFHSLFCMCDEATPEWIPNGKAWIWMCVACAGGPSSQAVFNWKLVDSRLASDSFAEIKSNGPWIENWFYLILNPTHFHLSRPNAQNELRMMSINHRLLFGVRAIRQKANIINYNESKRKSFISASRKIFHKIDHDENWHECVLKANR